MSGAERKIYSVADINRKVRMVLESGIGEVWVEGELSRVVVHGSGHWYFTLKDERAAVACAMFRNDNARVGFVPKDGLKVQMLSRPSVYEANGRYQLIASEMEEAGKGNLQEQFEKLKVKLKEEGLFDSERKKPLPLLPKKIGVVTSPTGAAVRDIIQVLTRRFPNIQVLLAPVPVQGKGAEARIVKAINYLNTRDDVDVMIVGRGGGSIEDLWNFNEEVVARAIAASRIPIISAVGHEIDFTIADFVADVRAPTPSAAAELAVREKAELEKQVWQLHKNVSKALLDRLQICRSRLELAARSYVFREPARLVKDRLKDLSAMQVRMGDLLQLSAQKRSHRVEGARERMAHLLQSGVRQAHQQVDELGLRMEHRAIRHLERDREKLERLQGQLRMLNPLAVLGRGYSLTFRSDGSVIRDVEEVGIGDSVTTRLANGKVVSKVTEKE